MATLSLTNLVLLAVAVVSVNLLVLGLRRRILLRIGLRNIARKRGQVAIAVAGLLVSTSIISGSLVFSDSWKATLDNVVIRGFDLTDETVTRQGATGMLEFFPYTTYGDLSQAVAAGASLHHVAAAAPRIIVSVAVNDNTTGILRTQATLVGYREAQDLGQFVLKAGTIPAGDLTTNEAILNDHLAMRLDAKPGDELRVFLGPAVRSVQLVAVTGDRGRGGWQNGDNLFVNLALAQELVGQPDRINYILVANVGGPTEGYRSSDAAAAELNTTLGSGFTVAEVKKDGLHDAEANSASLSDLFFVLSSFSIISGILLIVSIFVMLAEERKTEMGISRALGMRRASLVQTFILEGFVYALASAALGALAGVAVGATIIWVVGQIFEGLGEFVVIALLPSSLALAFGIGALLTLGTIAATSWYVSRLNVVRAIRSIPEPPPQRSTWMQLLLGTLSLGVGILLAVVAFPLGSSLDLSTGISLAALGLAALLLRAVNQRVLLTSTGLFLILWLLKPFNIIQSSVEILGFIIIGVLLVLAGVLLVMANSEALLAALTAIVRRRRTLLPVVRTAIAYPMNRRFRTAMSLAMFALIIFTITTLAMFQALFGSSVASFTQQFSGGYDIGGFSNPQTGVQNFSVRLAAGTLSTRIAYHEELTYGRALAEAQGMNRSVGYSIAGINGDFVNRSHFTLHALAAGYASADEAWRAVLANPTLAIVDRSAQPQDFGPPGVLLPIVLGGTVNLKSPAGTARTVTIIGVMDQSFAQAVFVAPEVQQALTNITTPSLFLFKVAQGQDAAAVGKDLERAFLDINLQTYVFVDVIKENIRGTLNFFYLLQGFLALGLIVGIAGLGVVTLRNVAERRNVMGALRALGFRRSMVLGAFLLENTFVALLGMGIGVVLGIGLAFRLRGQIEFLAHGDFVIPWTSLLLILGVAYGASLLATFSPARRAARMPPAEALRIAE